MQKRIFGVESEYALCYQSKDKDAISRLDEEALLEHSEELTHFVLRCVRDTGWPVAGEFLGNGGRLYIDRGGHPEYATPECASVRDLVAHEKAGDRFVQQLVEVARPLMAQDGRFGRLHVFKNNVDPFGHTYGGHENYLITPGAAGRIEAIVPFLVTRQIFTGAGKVTNSSRAGDVPYQVSQRADFFERIFNDRTCRGRSIINTRKREIPRPGENRRLHIIVGDCNMSEHAIGLKVGTTALVLRLLEEGSADGIPTLTAPVRALKRISRSPQAALRVDGKRQRYSALDIQSMFLEKVQRFFASREPSSEEKDILERWTHTLLGLKKLRFSAETGELEEDPDGLRRTIDWILKAWLLGRIKKQNHLEPHDSKLKSIDLRYHDLDSETGIFERCQALHLVDRMVDDEAIRQAQIDPPKDTRAWARGMLIRNMNDKNVEVQVENWEKIKIRRARKSADPVPSFLDHARKVNSLEIRLEDPFQAEDLSSTEEVQEFAESCG